MANRQTLTDTTSTPPGTLTQSAKLLCAATLLLVAANASAQDDYMMELEGAMEDVVPIEQSTTPPADTASTPSENTTQMSPQHESYLDEVGIEVEDMQGLAGGTAVPENARAQFDSDLKDRMPGTFVLYSRLPDGKKTQVFDEYQVSGDYLRVRRKIIELRRAH